MTKGIIRETEQYTDSELYSFLGCSAEVRNEAMSMLYDRHSQMLFRYCVRMLNNREAARDLTHECFFRLLRISDERRQIENVTGYLVRIARNLCINLRNAPRWNNEEFDETALPRDDTLIEEREMQGIVAAALDQLPTDYREAIVLQIYGGMSYEEIAQTLNVNLAIVRNRIARGKVKLRSILQPYFADVFE